jgi:transposase
LENRQDEMSSRMRGLIAGLYEDWICLDERIETIAGEIETIGEKEANCRRLMSVPGIGPLISTAVVAAIGTGEAFERGETSAHGLVLSRASTAQVVDPSWAASPSEGSKYLRTLFIQAPIVLMRPHNWERFSFGAWLLNAAPRLHRNKPATALANKLARIAWSILRNETAFDVPRHEVVGI